MTRSNLMLVCYLVLAGCATVEDTRTKSAPLDVELVDTLPKEAANQFLVDHLRKMRRQQSSTMQRQLTCIADGTGIVARKRNIFVDLKPSDHFPFEDWDVMAVSQWYYDGTKEYKVEVHHKTESDTMCHAYHIYGGSLDDDEVSNTVSMVVTALVRLGATLTSE